MSVKNLIGLDRFWLFLIFILMLLSILIIITFKQVFSSLKVAGEIDQKLINSLPRVDSQNLDKAYELIFNKKISLLTR